MIEALIREIDAHLAWRSECGAKMAESTFGRRAVNDGKLVDRLRGGGEITVSKMATIRQFIASDRKSVGAEAGRERAA